ncbi:MAG TPA: hypothetical protein VJP85_06125 [Candidatus Baltobacteraceae bacterium]|nr:hypothetical protein [Candidatus Baltobacteraceae bacterium]
MAIQKGRPAHPLLSPTGADALQRALVRLRANGLSGAEAATEIMRRNFYDFIDAQADGDTGTCPRLRIVKR